MIRKYNQIMLRFVLSQLMKTALKEKILNPHQKFKSDLISCKVYPVDVMNLYAIRPSYCITL